VSKKTEEKTKGESAAGLLAAWVDPGWAGLASRGRERTVAGWAGLGPVWSAAGNFFIIIIFPI
jgi:hypothetical protein